jgi:hypothetical protein
MPLKNYLRQVNDVQEGAVEEILPKDRKIIQPSRVLTEIVRQKIHQYLDKSISTKIGLGEHGSDLQLGL